MKAHEVDFFLILSILNYELICKSAVHSLRTFHEPKPDTMSNIGMSSLQSVKRPIVGAAETKNKSVTTDDGNL